MSVQDDRKYVRTKLQFIIHFEITQTIQQQQKYFVEGRLGMCSLENVLCNLNIRQGVNSIIEKGFRKKPAIYPILMADT